MKPIITQNITNVVVLMMENRSFDHLFGDYPNVNGIHQTPPLANYADPSNSSSEAYHPTPVTVKNQNNFNAGHSFGPMIRDIFGPKAEGYKVQNGKAQPIYPDGKLPSYTPSSMNGFISTNNNAQVMNYFQYLPQGDPRRLNVLHTLAENYVLCDNWFCDTPSETVPNRHFIHAATNMGYNESNLYPGFEPSGEPSKSEQNYYEKNLWNATTIYEQLDTISTQNGITNWAMYGFPQDEYDSGMYAYTAALPQANRSIFDFPIDVLTGNLPFYTFIMPSLLFGDPSHGSANGNSMHPASDVRLGENLIASVYTTLRNSPIWQNTLFIVTFDENGGLYDHVLPPSATPPDSHTYPPYGETLFDYTILGPRIPALLISPWLQKGGVDSTQYQNTSILRFAQDLFAAQNNYTDPTHKTLHITQRDASAKSFADSSCWLSEMRTDCPQSIALYEGFPNWGTELTDPYGGSSVGDPFTGPQIPGVGKNPSEAALDFAQSYCSQYPGHPDSGKPLTRTFATHQDLIQYMKERRAAARTFYKKNAS